MNGELAPVLIGPVLLGAFHFDPEPFGSDIKLHGFDDPRSRDAQHLTEQFLVVHAFSSAFSSSLFQPRNTTRFPGEPTFITESYSLNNLTYPFGVAFRIYGYIPGASGQSTSLLFDNITINGTVTQIPEPASGGLLLLGSLFLASARRRSKAGDGIRSGQQGKRA